MPSTPCFIKKIFRTQWEHLQLLPLPPINIPVFGPILSFHSAHPLSMAPLEGKWALSLLPWKQSWKLVSRWRFYQPMMRSNSVLNPIEHSGMSNKMDFPLWEAIRFGDCLLLLYSMACSGWLNFQSEAIFRSILHITLPEWPHTSPWFQPPPLYWWLKYKSAEGFTSLSKHILDSSTQLSSWHLKLSNFKVAFSHLLFPSLSL